MKRPVLSLLSLASLFLLGSCDLTHTGGGSDRINTYTVTWVNWDGSVLETDKAEKGSYPKFEGSDPVRKSEDGKNYVFTGWSPKIAPVSSDITYTAQYSSDNSYIVTWVNWDGSVLETDTVNAGITPTYSGATPEKESVEGKDYQFVGWSPKVAPVYSDITYTAQYTMLNSYTVTWVNWNGDVLETDKVSFGATPTYEGRDPVRESEKGKQYTFVGWSPKVTPVYSDITYTAQFTSEKSYTVTWKNWDGTILELDQGLAYGDMPSYDGATPTKPEESRLSFTFTGWTPEVTPVDSDVTYWANFTSEEITYTVTWLNYDGSILETDTDVKYGSMPSYDGVTPVEPSSGKTSYVFTGWSPELSPVYSDVTYKAEFREDQVFTVTWLDYDGTVLETDTQVPYGSYPSYDGATPTRAVEGDISYRFSNWYPYPSAVYSDVTYTAQYSSFTTQYTITFKDENGTVYSTSTWTKGSSVSQPAPKKKSTVAGKCYVLKGWYKEGDDNKTLVTDFTASEDATYIAVFELVDALNIRTLTKPNGEQYAIVLGLNDKSLTDVTIPSTYQGVTVTSIAARAFESSSVTSITLPDSINSIGEYAFRSCSNLTSVNLPEGITDLPKYLFFSCSSLTGISLPSTLKSIGEHAFSYCTQLTLIEIPEGVTKILSGTFYGCSKLTSVSLPSTIKSIETTSSDSSDGAFSCCNSLASIVIPDGVTSIDYHAFYGCKKLSSVTLPSTLQRIEYGVFNNCSSLKSIVIPDSVAQLGYSYEVTWADGIFENCTNLVSVTLPKSLNSISNRLFKNCTSLKNVAIPSSVTGISSEAFSGCTAIDHIIIPSSVTTISENAFSSTYCNFYLEASAVPSGWSSGWNGSAYGSCVYYSATSNTDGSHWHYDSDGKTPILWK